MADEWPFSNDWYQATRSLARIPGGAEQPQHQPHPRARPFNGAVRDSGSTTHQSRQSYIVQPHVQSQSQLHSQAQPQLQSYQAAGSSSINNARPNDNLNNILTHFLRSLDQFGVQQRHVNESLSKSDKCLEALVSSVLSIREIADGLAKKLEAHDEILGKLERNSRVDDKKAKEIDVIKVLVGEMKAFKNTLGKSCDGDDGRTVLGRLDAVTFAVGELLERARDPEANLPGPSATTETPCIIDLTESSPPPVRRTSPFQNHTYADVGTSPVPSLLPLKEEPFASVQVSTSIRSGSDPFGSFLLSSAELTPYPGRSSSVHSFVNDTTTTGSTTMAQDNLELASLISMEVDAVDPTEPVIDSQPSSSISTSNSDDANRTQTNSQLSDHASETTTKAPRVETVHTAHLSIPSDLTSANDIQTSEVNTGSDRLAHKNDRPPGTRPLNVTPGPGLGISTFMQPYTIASASTASTFSASPTPSFTHKTIAALRASVRLNPYTIATSSVGAGKQQQNERSQEQGLLERLELSVSTSRETLSLDNMNSDRLNMSADGIGYNEEKIKAMKEVLDEEGKQETKRIEKPVFGFNGNHKSDLPISAPGLIDLSQHVRDRRSSSRFASPFTSLSLLSSKGRTGSSVGPSEDVSHPSRLSSDTKLYSPTKTKVLAGVVAGRSPVPPTASSSTASVTTRTPVTTPVRKAASVSSHSALRPTMVNPELVAAPTNWPATPASTRRITPATSESSHLESASTPAPVMITKPLPLSQTSTLPAATSSVLIPVISLTKNSGPVASSRLDPAASPSTISNEPLTSSQASTNTTQEASVSSMVIEEEDKGDEGDLVEKPTEIIELKTFEEEEAESESEDLINKMILKTAGHKFEKEEETKRGRPSLSSFPPLPSLSPSISGSPHLRPVKVSEPSTPRPRSDLSFTLLPCSPLATAISKNRSQNDETPEPNSVFSLSPPSPVTCTPPLLPQRQSQMRNVSLAPEEVALEMKSPDDSHGTTEIEMLLPRDLSPIPNVEGEKTVEGTDKTQVEKLYTSLGEDADIVRAKKRKVSERPSMTDEPLASLVAQGMEKAKDWEIDNVQVETKSSEPAKKKQSLFNLKVEQKGDSVAITRVKKRKSRPDFIADEETNEKGQHNDGLDEEKPLKRARLRVSDRQMKVEPVKKGKQLSRELSGSSFGAGTSTRATTPRSSTSVKKGPSLRRKSSVNIGQGEAEVQWPTMTKGDQSEDLVGCDKCTAWYHYGCVGLNAGDKRIRGGKKFFCPPCEAGTAIKKFNKDTECWRPGCSVPTGFIVEKIIGRFKKYVGGQGLQFKYLLQWKGYDLSESSWEPEESMFDPPFMIEKFRVDALEEGIDIDQDKSGLILLQEAKNPSVPPPSPALSFQN